jgi:phi13 family phage major tail protein
MATYGIKTIYAGDINDTVSGLSASNIRQFVNPQALSIKPKTNTDQGYAGNRMIDNAALFQNAEIGLNIYDLTNSDEAFLLSKSQPSSGGTIAAAEDEGKYKCILYNAPLRRKNSSGIAVNRYGYIYKVQFIPYDAEMKGLEGKPDLSQTPQLTGTAFGTDYSYVDEMGRTIHPWHYWIDDDDPNCPEDIASIWMNQILLPSYDKTPLTVSSVPANSATGVADASSIVFTFNKVLNAATVIPENFLLFKSINDAAVPFNLSLDTTGMIVTITPVSNFTTTTNYIAVVTTNVSDYFSNSLATPEILSFTTA